MNPTRVAILALLFALTGCCSSEEKPEPPPPRGETKTTERIAEGSPEEVIPRVMAALAGDSTFGKIVRDDDAVVAEVCRLPGLGIALPAAEYFLRIDFEKVEDTTRLILAFYRLKTQLDSLAAQAVAGLFQQVFVAMLKSGVVFL